MFKGVVEFMKLDKEYVMRECIKRWGLPDCLSDRSEEVVYKFDVAGITNTYEETYFADE